MNLPEWREKLAKQFPECTIWYLGVGGEGFEWCAEFPDGSRAAPAPTPQKLRTTLLLLRRAAKERGGGTQ